MSQQTKSLAIAITGASGCAYTLRLIEVLVKDGHQLYIMISTAGQIVLRMEGGLDIPANPPAAQKWLTQYFNASKNQITVYGKQEWTAPLASGSNPVDTMIVCPCTTGTLASIANGMSQSLIERACDVMIKEQRKLILVIRETPFSTIHLDNMQTLARAGVVIMPANPGFYHSPQTLQDIVDFMVARILDHIGIKQTLLPMWGE